MEQNANSPPRIKKPAFKDPDDRLTWEPHGTDAWYIGPAMLHYRLLRFFDPRTGGETETGTFRLYPAHCRPSTISKGDKIIAAAAELFKILKLKEPDSVRERREHVSILKQLQLILNKKSTDIRQNRG